MKFKYYVLNWNHNKKEIEQYNIFRNSKVQQYTEKEIKKYLAFPSKYRWVDYYNQEVHFGIEALYREIDSIIK